MPELATIWAEVEAGEPVILLPDLRDQPYMPRPNGRKLDKSVPFRWATRGCRGTVLESITTPTGKSTTRSAVLRFFAKLSGVTPQAADGRTRRGRARAIESAGRELEAAGI